LFFLDSFQEQLTHAELYCSCAAGTGANTASLAEATCESLRGKLSISFTLRKAPRNNFHANDQNSMTTMADEDEELAHLRAPDAADNDAMEEDQDFCSFDKLVFAALTHVELRES
jgi:hypothetical protein